MEGGIIMLSEFGKFTRKLRIDHSELLKDMAIKLNVTTSYLSAVEMGKRKVPEVWKEILIDKYQLNENEIKSMNEAVYNSQNSIKFNLENYSQDDKNLILSFARRFNELEEEEKKSIWETLDK